MPPLPTEHLERLGQTWALDAPTERKRMLIIVNPYATTVSVRLKNLVVYALQGRYEVTAVETKARNHATELCREARAEGERIIADAKRQVTLALEALRRVQAQRVRFLRLFRALVERQLSEIEQEEERTSALARLDAEVDRPDALEEGES